MHSRTSVGIKTNATILGMSRTRAFIREQARVSQGPMQRFLEVVECSARKAHVHSSTRAFNKYV
jgi:hypothetical protein